MHGTPPAGSVAVHASAHWSNRRHRVETRAGIGPGRHAQVLSTESSTLAVDCCSGLRGKAYRRGARRSSRAIASHAPGPEKWPTHRAAARGGWLMNLQAPLCRPRQCWLWCACTGVIHKVIHAGCGLCGRRLRPPARSLVNPQAPRCKPRRHWLCAACTGLFHRVIHGGCGLVRPPRPGTHGKGAGGVDAGRQSGGAGAALMNSQAPRCRPRQCWLWRACPVLVHRVIHAVCGRCARMRVPCGAPCAGH